MSLKTPEAYEEYKIIRNESNASIQRIKNEYWEKFTKDMEYDFYGLQKHMWRFIRNQITELRELVETTKIKELYKKTKIQLNVR